MVEIVGGIVIIGYYTNIKDFIVPYYLLRAGWRERIVWIYAFPNVQALSEMQTVITGFIPDNDNL